LSTKARPTNSNWSKSMGEVYRGARRSVGGGRRLQIAMRKSQISNLKSQTSSKPQEGNVETARGLRFRRTMQGSLAFLFHSPWNYIEI
jgi:hypothetical protein